MWAELCLNYLQFRKGSCLPTFSSFLLSSGWESRLMVVSQLWLYRWEQHPKKWQSNKLGGIQNLEWPGRSELPTFLGLPASFCSVTWERNRLLSRLRHCILGSLCYSSFACMLTDTSKILKAPNIAGWYIVTHQYVCCLKLYIVSFLIKVVNTTCNTLNINLKASA